MRREGPGQRSDYAAPVAERPVLALHRADGTSVEYELVRDQPLTLGREPGNDVVLKSTFVSKQHAVVRYEGGQFVVEDLKSANGTRVNGSPISVSLLTPGDKIEVGDQNLTFFDRAAPKPGAAKKGDTAGRASAGPAASSPVAKMARLGGVALIFGVGLFLMLRFLLIGNAPPAYDDGSGGAPAAAWPVAGGATAPLANDSPLIQQVLAQAKTAGVSPADALYDEAVSQVTSGRLLEAARLFSAVVQREPTRTVAKIRLNETRDQLEGAIAKHHAEAERMTSQLRYDDAVFEWERVLQLLEPTDPRVPAAKAGIDAAKSHLAHK
jgi:FHA domain